MKYITNLSELYIDSIIQYNLDNDIGMKGMKDLSKNLKYISKLKKLILENIQIIFYIVKLMMME